MAADMSLGDATRLAGRDRTDEPPVIQVRNLGPGEATGFVSIEGTALYLGMGRRFVEELLAKREIPSFKFGRSRRIRFCDLEEWASRHQEE
jgi:excisionase family DNA binding protein